MAWNGSGKDRRWKWHCQATLHAARKQVAIVVEEEGEIEGSMCQAL